MSKRPWYYQGLVVAVNICHNSHLMFMSIVVRVKENDSINGSVNTPSCFVPATQSVTSRSREFPVPNKGLDLDADYGADYR